MPSKSNDNNKVDVVYYTQIWKLKMKSVVDIDSFLENASTTACTWNKKTWVFNQ